MKTLLTTTIICLAAQSVQARPSTYSIFNAPTAHEEYLDRQHAKDVKRANRKQTLPVPVSYGAMPPNSDGRREKNSLGTVYCGIKGCWRQQ